MKVSVRQFGCLLVTIIYAVGFVCLIAVVVSLLCGCTSTKYVPVETVRTEYRDADTTAIYNNLLRLFESKREKEARSDSLVDRTKEVVVLKESGDTVKLFRDRIIYRATASERELEVENKMLRDSIFTLNSRFALKQEESKPLVVTVERKLSRWEKFKMDFGGIAFGGVFVAIAIAVVWLIRKFRR